MFRVKSNCYWSLLVQIMAWCLIISAKLYRNKVITHSNYDLDCTPSLLCCNTGIILCMCPANERWRYSVTPSLTGWAHTQNDILRTSFIQNYDVLNRQKTNTLCVSDLDIVNQWPWQEAPHADVLLQILNVRLLVQGHLLHILEETPGKKKSRAVMSYASCYSDHFSKIWMRSNLNFHWFCIGFSLPH